MPADITGLSGLAIIDSILAGERHGDSWGARYGDGEFGRGYSTLLDAGVSGRRTASYREVKGKRKKEVKPRARWGGPYPDVRWYVQLLIGISL